MVVSVFAGDLWKVLNVTKSHVTKSRLSEPSSLEWPSVSEFDEVKVHYFSSRLQTIHLARPNNTFAMWKCIVSEF